MDALSVSVTSASASSSETSSVSVGEAAAPALGFFPVVTPVDAVPMGDAALDLPLSVDEPVAAAAPAGDLYRFSHV